MNELITTWLFEQGVSSSYLQMSTVGIGLIIILLLSTLGYYLAKNQILHLAHKIIVKTKTLGMMP